VCLLDSFTTQILTSTTVSIECVSWLIKVTNNDDARWKPEINCSYVIYYVRLDRTVLSIKLSIAIF
jgi:hypothetical protein